MEWTPGRKHARPPFAKIPLMGSDPDVSEIPHRRRRVGLWKATPIWVKAVIGVCLLFVAAFPYIKDRWPEKLSRSAPPRTANAPENRAIDKMIAEIPKVDLVLTQSALNTKTRCIEGIVTNGSNRLYTDIAISFYHTSSDQTASWLAYAQVDRLDPHQSANFATPPVRQDLNHWVVKNIRGTPH
jgi:hypothetical protein